MNTQYLQYVREQLMVATADLSGETKGQLLAWLENAQFDTKNYPRKKQRIWDEETESWITLNNPPNLVIIPTDTTTDKLHCKAADRIHADKADAATNRNRQGLGPAEIFQRR